jgi:hypothetical protein
VSPSRTGVCDEKEERIITIIHSARAPEMIRRKVKVAGSMFVCLSAARQSNELLANAIIANEVRMKTRVFNYSESNVGFLDEIFL